MKKYLILLACYIMSLLTSSGQEFIQEDIAKIEKTPEVLSLYQSAIHYVLLYENETDSLQKALTYIEKAISLNPEVLTTQMWKGEILFRIGRKEESLNQFISLCGKKECPGRILLLTGILQEHLGNQKQAYRYYEHALHRTGNILSGNKGNLKDFINYLMAKFFMENKLLSIDEVKELLPENLKNTDEKTIRKITDEMSTTFADRENYIRNFWKYKAKTSSDHTNKDIEIIKSFYTSYITNSLKNQDKRNQALMEQYFLPELIAEADEIADYSGADNVLRAQDVSPKMLTSLKIRHLKDDWYMVSYYCDRKTEIPLKMTSRKGKRLIEYIIPLNMDTDFGNHLLPNVIMLKDFYTTYIGNRLDNKESDNRFLAERYLSSGLINSLKERGSFYASEFILHSNDVTESMRGAVQVEYLDNDWYAVTIQGSKTIHVKTVYKDGITFIKYIVPEKEGMAYGDKLIPETEAAPAECETDGWDMLNHFYRTYLTNGLKGDTKANRILTKHYLAFDFCNTFRKVRESSGDNLLLQNEDKFTEDMLENLKVEPVENNRYIVSYKNGNQHISILIELVCQDEKWYIEKTERYR